MLELFMAAWLGILPGQPKQQPRGFAEPSNYYALTRIAPRPPCSPKKRCFYVGDLEGWTRQYDCGWEADVRNCQD